ncbi:MAG: metallophosphoesterase family protein [Candidatus Hadarchaeota archaeon]
MTKIALIADPHSNLLALEAVFKDMPGVDRVVCAGDLVGYGAEPNEVVGLLKSKGVQTVKGNHDQAALTRDVGDLNSIAAEAALWTSRKLSQESLRHLSGLATELRLKIGKSRIYVVHGSPRDPMNEYIFPDISNQELARLVEGVEEDIIVLGHTHIQMKRMILGKLVVNPGGVGQPRDGDPRASYAVLTIEEDVKVEFRRVEYDVAAAAEKITAAGLPEELASRLSLGW